MSEYLICVNIPHSACYKTKFTRAVVIIQKQLHVECAVGEYVVKIVAVIRLGVD
jgi:hypothetical protein